METVMQIVGGIVALVSLVCYVLVLIQMFQHGQTGLGIACIVLLFCCGIGALIAFIVGWMNARAWNITNVMIAWTVCWVINLGTSAYTYPLVMQRYNQVRPQ